MDTETTPHPYGPGDRRALHRLHLAIGRSYRWRDGKLTKRGEVVCHNRNNWWNWLLPQMSLRRPLWLWSHGLSFDLCALRVWELLEGGELNLKAAAGPPKTGAPEAQERREKRGAVVTGDPPTVLVCYDRAGAKLVCVDTLNWLMRPLAWVGERVGLPKLSIPGDEGTDDDWLNYCTRDVDILEALLGRLLTWHRGGDLGNLRWTLASQSVQAWRHWGEATRVVVHDDLAVKARERASYYGGREECYYVGHVYPSTYEGLEGFASVAGGLPLATVGPVTRLDVVSCYPAVMRSNRYPTKLAKVLERPEIREVARWLAGGCACAEVVIESRGEPWPARHGTETWWQTGRFATVLCGPELIRALRGGYVRAVNWAQLYLAGEPFTDFARRCMDGRAAADAAGDQITSALWKGLANDLHGKMAQKRHRWATLHGEMSPCPWGLYPHEDKATHERTIRRAVAWQAQELTRRGEVESSSPILAAYVASYARELLREMRLDAGHRGVVYENADSLHATKAGIIELTKRGWLTTSEPGKLRVEQVAWQCCYRGPKDYTLDEHEVCGGLSRKAVMGPRGMFRQDEFARLDVLLSGGRPAGPVSFERILTRPVHVVRACVGLDGWTTPLEV